jgi:hypothetical protein
MTKQRAALLIEVIVERPQRHGTGAIGLIPSTRKTDDLEQQQAEAICAPGAATGRPRRPARRAAPQRGFAMKKKFSIDFKDYSRKGAQRPYIGVVDPTSANVLRWGNWIGDPGSEGMLEIVAEEGDVILVGQKYGDQDYYFVKDDLTLLLMAKSAAIKAGRAHKQQVLSNPSATFAELFRLLDAKTLPEAIARVQQLKEIEAAQTAEPETTDNE